MVLFAGIGLYQALAAPPFRWSDEQAHTGYTLSVAHGHLPEIDTPIPIPANAPALAKRVQSSSPRNHTIWVANHPPLVPVLAAPFARLAVFSGHGDLTVFVLRFLNLLGVLAAIGLTFVLARDLSGGNAVVGVAAAGLLASLAHLTTISSAGMSDGPTMAATTAALVAFTRLARGTSARWPLLVLSAALVACGLTRLTAVGFGAVIAVATLVLLARRTRRVPWRAALVLGLPVTLASGWFWVRNSRLYGDVGASQFLLDRFGRKPRGSILEVLGDRSIWNTVLRSLFTTSREVRSDIDPSVFWYQLVVAVVVVSTVIVVAMLAIPRLRARVPAGLNGTSTERVDLPVVAWLVALATVPLTVLMMAQFLAGGGGLHPRYLFAALPVLVTIVALALVRVGGPRLAAGAILGLVVLDVSQALRLVNFLAREPLGPVGSVLRDPVGPRWLRLVCLGAGLMGAAVLATVLTGWGRPELRRQVPSGLNGSRRQPEHRVTQAVRTSGDAEAEHAVVGAPGADLGAHAVLGQGRVVTGEDPEPAAALRPGPPQRRDVVAREIGAADR
jgi:4-amino-4-deoxy-L-arabinose transferase-like glycosyltransferase